jgi:hypothetical protein
MQPPSSSLLLCGGHFRWHEDIEELSFVDDIALQQNAAFVNATLCDLFQLCCFQTALPSLRTPDQ